MAGTSDRLDALIHTATLRNFRAVSKHFDAAGCHDFGEGMHRREEAAYDRFTRGWIESGICWRDVGVSRFGGEGRT